MKSPTSVVLVAQANAPRFFVQTFIEKLGDLKSL